MVHKNKTSGYCSLMKIPLLRSISCPLNSGPPKAFQAKDTISRVAFLIRKDGSIQTAHPSSLVSYVFQGKLRMTFSFLWVSILEVVSESSILNWFVVDQQIKLNFWNCKAVEQTHNLNLLSVSTCLLSNSSSRGNNKRNLLGGVFWRGKIT